MSLGGKVAIVGSGVIKYGENFHQSLTDMIYEAVTQALADPLNLFQIPVTRVAAYCATGIEAVRNAALAVASGEYDVVLAVGAEKMREVPSRGSLVAQAVNRGHPVLAKGRTAPGMFALLATRYFKEYGADEEALGAVAVKNHYHGSLNPKAHFQKEITPEQHRRAPKVAEPLGLFDCCPTTDGAAAVVLARADLAPKLTDTYTILRGVAFAVTAGYWNTQFDPSWSFTSFRSSGIRMIANIHDQLLGRAGRMQVKGATLGLAHNLGGPGAVSAVAVLSQP